MCACGVEALGNGCGEEKGYVAGLFFLALRAGAAEERAIARVDRGLVVVAGGARACFVLRVLVRGLLTLDVLHLVLCITGVRFVLVLRVLAV